jgi:hypothetical protein
VQKNELKWAEDEENAMFFGWNAQDLLKEAL